MAHLVSKDKDVSWMFKFRVNTRHISERLNALEWLALPINGSAIGLAVILLATVSTPSKSGIKAL